MTETHTLGSRAKVRRQRSRFPSPQEVSKLIAEIRADAELIPVMYARLHSLGLEPPRGENVHAGGSGTTREDGSETGYVPELAVASDQADKRRDSARWVAKQLHDVAHTLFLVRQGLEAHVGPGPGFRQSQTLGSDAIISLDEFTEALDNQGRRLKAGAE